MNRPQIEELVTRWATQAVAAGRDEVWDDLLADDVIDRSGGGEARGRESFKARARAVQAAFGDRVVVVDDLVVDGDHIAWRWTLTGTHVGAFLDIQPTGGRITLRGVNFQRVRGGAVCEHWTLADLAGLARQLRAHFATQL
jgi:predicted ester cyclase